jgi:hypothetical protein
MPQTPFPEVTALPVADAAEAAKVKAAAMAVGPPRTSTAEGLVAAPGEALVTKPGSERWPVKTGTDSDAITEEIVDATVEEMVLFPRPKDMEDVKSLNPDYQAAREKPTETTIWRIKGEIITLKMEADGDYHLVVQGASGATMIAEIPHPDKPYVVAGPWNDQIKTARAAADATLLKKVSLAGFAPLNGKLVPPESFTVPPPPHPAAVEGLTANAAPVAFSTRIEPTSATITGPGFFDKVHGQAGVSSFNGIEIHPVLAITFD